MFEDMLSQYHASPAEDWTHAATRQRIAWAPNFSLLKRMARAGLAVADNFCAALSAGLLPETPSLIAVGLHSLCSNKSQIDDPALAPNQNVTVDDFRCFVDAMLESGYTAVSPIQIDAGLQPGGKYVMVTFDDGYFNNVLALDVLEKYEVPATFFISSNNVLEHKAFWWDVLNRELCKAGASAHARNAEIRKVKALATENIDEYLHGHFGKAAFNPQGDRDRPFTPSELAAFARHPWVHLGNHTGDHAILTHCSPQKLAQQIQSCQEALTNIAGYAPISIAYPNGNHSPAVVQAAQSAGLRVGVTVQPRRNPLPLGSASTLMTLGRFYCRGGMDPRVELRKFRAGFIPSNLIKSVMRSSWPGGPG